MVYPHVPNTSICRKKDARTVQLQSYLLLKHLQKQVTRFWQGLTPRCFAQTGPQFWDLWIAHSDIVVQTLFHFFTSISSSFLDQCLVVFCRVWSQSMDFHGSFPNGCSPAVLEFMEVFNPWGYHPAIGVAPWQPHRFPSQGDMFQRQWDNGMLKKETHIQCQPQIHKLSLSQKKGGFSGRLPPTKTVTMHLLIN